MTKIFRLPEEIGIIIKDTEQVLYLRSEVVNCQDLIYTYIHNRNIDWGSNRFIMTIDEYDFWKEAIDKEEKINNLIGNIWEKHRNKYLLFDSGLNLQEYYHIDIRKAQDNVIDFLCHILALD